MNRNDFYRRNERFTWIVVLDNKVCQDCIAISTTQPKIGLTFEEWNARGMPGSGHTRCKHKCRCMLVPVGTVIQLELTQEELGKVTGVAGTVINVKGQADKLTSFVLELGKQGTDAYKFAEAIDDLTDVGIVITLAMLWGLTFKEQKEVVNKIYEEEFGEAIVW